MPDFSRSGNDIGGGGGRLWWLLAVLVVLAGIVLVSTFASSPLPTEPAPAGDARRIPAPGTSGG